MIEERGGKCDVRTCDTSVTPETAFVLDELMSEWALLPTRLLPLLFSEALLDCSCERLEGFITRHLSITLAKDPPLEPPDPSTDPEAG